jgi:hypothetical protein
MNCVSNERNVHFEKWNLPLHFKKALIIKYNIPWLIIKKLQPWLFEMKELLDKLEEFWCHLWYMHNTKKGPMHIYLWRKVVCLFCFVFMRSTKGGCFRLHSWSLLKALKEEGCIGLVFWRLYMSCKTFWILNDFFSENWIKS